MKPDWKGWLKAFADVVNSAAFNITMVVGACAGLLGALLSAHTEAEREALGTGAVFAAVGVSSLIDALAALRKRHDDKGRHDG